MKLLYISSARLPSTRAHSIQIMKMAEAFSDLAEIILYVARIDGAPEESFRFYGIAGFFPVVSAKWPFKTKFGRIKIIWVFLKGYFFSLKIRPDFIYLREFILAFLFSFFMEAKNIVLEVHSIPIRYKFMFKLALKRAGKLIVTNEAKKLEIMDKCGVSADKIFLARNGVDLREFDRILKSKEELRRELKLPEGKTLFGFVGNFTAKGLDKGLELTFEAFSKINFPFGLVFVGDGKKEHEIYLEKAKKHGLRDELFLQEYVPHHDVPKWLKAMDFLILPYAPAGEHFLRFMSPLKAAEYMASGVPILSSDLPALKEFLSGFAVFFKAGDVKDYREKIGWAKNNLAPCKSMAALAAKRASEEFSWDRRAKEILAFIS